MIHSSLTSSEPVYRLRARTQFLLEGNKLRLLLGRRHAVIESFDEVIQKFLERISQGGTRRQFCEYIRTACSEDDWHRVERCLDYLLQKGFVEFMNLAHTLNPLDEARFDRLLHFFSEHETAEFSRFDFLNRLSKARVGIVGTGGLGSWIVYNLLCCGIGYVRLIDGDRVEASNLNRSILYTEDDIGDFKVHAAMRAAQRFAPRAQVEGHTLFVSSAQELLPYIQDLDLVIGAADQPPWLIREWITRACLLSGVPCIQGGGLRVGPFYIPGESSCVMCHWALLSERNPHYPNIIASQKKLPKGTTGSISPMGTITAGVMSMEVFRYLGGHKRPTTINALWEMDGNLQATLHPVPPHPACQVCGEGAVKTIGQSSEEREAVSTREKALEK